MASLFTSSIAFKSAKVAGEVAAKVMGNVSILVKLGLRVTLPLMPGGGYVIEVYELLSMLCEGVNQQIDSFKSMDQSSKLVRTSVIRISTIVRSLPFFPRPFFFNSTSIFSSYQKRFLISYNVIHHIFDSLFDSIFIYDIACQTERCKFF
jgi:hypothetical protein